MARKAIVDRDTVLQLLREGKTSQSIASQFGVSRQAIDLYRKEFVHTGVLEQRVPYRTIEPPKTLIASSPGDGNPPPAAATRPPPIQRQRAPAAINPQNVSLDQMIDLLIRAFDAMKRIPELEAEMTKVRQSYTEAMAQIEQLQAREQKRKEQEARWIHAQQPGVITGPQ